MDVADQDLTFIVNRPTTPAGQGASTLYNAPGRAKIGEHNLKIEFHADANGTGDKVGIAATVASITSGTVPELQFTVYSGIKSLRVLPEQRLPLGQVVEPLFEARNPEDVVVALVPGAAQWVAEAGESAWRTTDHGAAVETLRPTKTGRLQVTVDGRTSESEMVRVVSAATLTLAPATATIGSEFELSVSAHLSGAAENGIVWNIDGGDTNGRIENPSDGGARFVAPRATGTDHRTCTVRATSTWDPNLEATAVIDVASTIAVDLTPTRAELDWGGDQVFSAEVRGLSARLPSGSPLRGVEWRVVPDGSGKPVGTISSLGKYAAPERDGVFRVEAVSRYDDSRLGAAEVVVTRSRRIFEIPRSTFSGTLGVSDLSADGSVVALNFNNQGYLWNEQTGFTPVGGYVMAVSGDGTTATGQYLASPRKSAFVWTASSGTTLIGTNENQAGMDVTRDGGMVVGANGSPGFLWRRGQTSVETPWIPQAVSQDGTVVAGIREIKPDYRTRVVRLEGESLVEVGTNGDARENWVVAISDDGSKIVGFSGNSTSDHRVFRWSSTGGFEDIGLPPGATYLLPSGASPDCEWIFVTTAVGRFIWRSDHGFTTVSDFLQEEGLSALAGWTNFGILRCSTDKRILLGYGVDADGKDSGWIAVL